MGLEQIGQKLRAAREAQGLSLPQVFERTKIPINHLQSIENGQTEDLPEPVYISGFLKRFGDCVGLNGQSLSDEYRSQNGNSPSPAESQTWAPRIIHQPQPVISHGYMRNGLEVRAPNIIKQGLLYSVLIVMVLGIMSFLFTWQSNYQNGQQDPTSQLLKNGRYTGVFNNGGNQPQAPTATQTAPPATTPAADSEAVGDAQPVAPTTSADAGASVAINASQHVWVEITSVGSGLSLYTGFMERGERKDFKDPQGLRVHAGNGSSVTVEADGKNETLGLPGKIAEKVFMGKSATIIGTTPGGATIPLTPEAKAAAAAAALKAAAVKKAIKKPLTADAAPRRHTRPAEDVSAHSSAPAAAIDVPYRYTENHSDNE
jgi:cytoskeleton protein RodZ